ncbi:hypothetical protein LJB94_02905, partial [Odoribacter sp. OttesenSCG-928-G04]|nr:hypothetical protein [Odoribacter sp. OttesenSCG-928-G04]
DTVMLSDNAELNITGYLNTPILTMDNNATINMASGTLLSATSLEMNSATSSINVIGNNYSILDAGNLVLNAWDKGMFTGWLDIHGTVENKSGLKLDWLSNIRENGDTYLAADNFCTPEFGMGTDGEEDEILIDHIAEVASPNSKLSATSIQAVGDKAYVSYHVKGDGYGAAIDAFDVNSLEILSSCTAEEMDFNHILVEPSKVIVAGGEKRGALAGIITLNSGRFEAADFVKQKLAGGSANCIANNGSNYVVSSNTGFQALDLELAPLAIDPIEARYAKHVSIQGDKMVTLSGVENAEVKIFNATDIAMENPLQQFTVGAINPIDGKNVCRLDGDRVYVCKSKNGFAVYENGAEIWSLDKVANGVDFDDNYIYLVGEGLRIIDKTTFEVLAKYTHSEASANYVAAMEDGYIYVAYGLKGSQLFRLVSSNETK